MKNVTGGDNTSKQLANEEYEINDELRTKK